MKSHLDRSEAKMLGELAREFELNPPTSAEKFPNAIKITINNGIAAEDIAAACSVDRFTFEDWRRSKNLPGYFARRRFIRQIINLLREKQRLLETP